MHRTLVLPAVLLVALPLLSQAPSGSDPALGFQLVESKQDVRRVLGAPKEVAAFGADFESWQYQIDVSDEHEYSHLLVFHKSTDELISVTRNYETERPVDALFPEADTQVMSYPDATHPQYTLRLRRLVGRRVLMAMGVAVAGQPTGQIVLMRESELRTFYPWVVEQLKK